MTHLSVLDSRKGEWRSRKEWWDLNTFEGRESIESRANGVSIFDPVLAELFYGWYCPKGGNILDPFAGGPQRGYVAQKGGWNYTGVDINQDQVSANKSYGVDVILGDSTQVIQTLQPDFDLVFTCPPYYDLEKYTDDPRDLSNQSWQEFTDSYGTILQHSYDKLKNNRFMVIVVSEVREPSLTRNYKIGAFRGLVPLTIELAERAGFRYYNEFIYLHRSERAAKQVNRLYKLNRKVPRVHQNVLVFIKGNPDIATIDIDYGALEPICEVDGIPYRSFREAAICTDPSLVASDIKWRCGSKSYPTYRLLKNPDEC